MAPALFLALSLFASDPTMDTGGAVEPLSAAPGEPRNEYQLVAWCYGALSAHMALHDQAMPEVERIENTFETHPGDAKEEIAFYGQQQKDGKKQLALFRRAMTAAEKASIRPIQQEGAAAIAQGEAVWAGSATADKRRLAQEWMSWALPERCTPTATALEKKASVLGAALSYNADAPAPEAAPEAATADEPAATDQPAAETPPEPETAADAVPDATAPTDEPAAPAPEATAPTDDAAAPPADAAPADDSANPPSP
jgi:hypothetical protein